MYYALSAQVINLKRFQYMNGRWVKSHKIVRFPRTDFDPTKYLAPRAPRKVEEQAPSLTSHPLDEGGGEGSNKEAKEAEQQTPHLSNGQSQTGSDAHEISKRLSEVGMICQS